MNKNTLLIIIREYFMLIVMPCCMPEPYNLSLHMVVFRKELFTTMSSTKLNNTLLLTFCTATTKVLVETTDNV
jgi:hypothetical protein